MGTYKVIQDIESEDKLLGPLTLRQFVYAGIVAVLSFISFKLSAVSPLLIIPFLLPIGFFGLLAAPFGHDQSSEVWLLAKIGFFLKPRRRIWDQTGLQQLVTITVPKKIEQHLTDGLSQTEVKSRLRALADTIDSRGWAVKNINVNLYNQPSYLSGNIADSDRLVAGSSLPQDVPNFEVMAADDILDPANNPTAQHLDAMINQSEQDHRKSVVSAIHGDQPSATQPADYWFMNQADNPQPIPAGNVAFDDSSTIAPGTQPIATNTAPDNGVAEQELLEQIHEENAKPNPAYGHMKVLDPRSGESFIAGHAKKKVTTSKPTTHPAGPTANKAMIARLAGDNDKNVATIAREAQKSNPNSGKLGDDEVVISLR